MMNVLQTNPSKALNRILLIAGIIIFCPLYYLNYFLITQIMDMNLLSKLLTSFDVKIFREIILPIETNGQLDTLFNVYLVNIGSTIGFMLIFFSITLMIARSLDQASKIHNIAFLFPIIAIVIALFDILPSIAFLLLSKNTGIISAFTAYFIDGSYILRMVLLYITFLWIIVMGTFVIIRNIGRRIKYRKEAA